MRILAIYRHYWPDSTPYARILRTLLEHLAAAGHQTAVFTAQPGYNGVRHLRQPWRETLNSVDVQRVFLLPERKSRRLGRAINWIYFLIRAILHSAIGRRYDLIIANSHPPILMGCALRLIRALRRTPYIYHCQDLHPEAAVAAGDLHRNKLHQLLLQWDTKACREAERVVVLSRDMAESLARRGLPPTKVSIINNPPLAVDTTVRSAPPPLLEARTTAVRFLFAGNLGRFQDLERVVAAARLVAGSVDYQLIFMGEGDAKRALETEAGDLINRRIFFLPQQSVETAVAAMQACDFGIVSLLPDMCRYAFPSKCIMYLSAGCPVIALVERESELAHTIEKHDLGYVVAGRALTDIDEVLTRAVAERHRWTAARRAAIAKLCGQLFGESRMLSDWDELLAPSATTLRRAA